MHAAGIENSVVIEMKSSRPVSDEDLNAYIDGQLPRQRRCEVERLIARDEGVRMQVESLRRVHELVRMAYIPNKQAMSPAQFVERRNMMKTPPAIFADRCSCWHGFQCACSVREP